MDQETRIGRLQLHTRGRQGNTARLGITRALRQTRLHPAHLPSSAILVIRQLTHKTPLGSGALDAQRWSRRLQQEVDVLARQAVRPAQQANGHLAQSVLFLDPVELLVCFTRDALDRRTLWYWQELFPVMPTHNVGDQLVGGWSAYPEAVPATMTELSPAVVRQVIRQLHPTQIRQVVTCVHQHFGLADGAIQNQPLPVSAKRAIEVAREGSGGQARVHAPWQTWVPVDVGQGLPPLSAYLIGLCYTLVRAPELARTAHFMAEASAWIEQQEQIMPASNQAAIAATTVNDDPESRPSMVNGDQEQASLDKRGEGVVAPGDGHPVVTMWTEVSAQSRMANQGLRSDHAATELQQPIPTLGGPAADSAALADDIPSVEAPEVAWTDPTGIETALGGAFYLLNVITWLQREKRLPDHEPTNLWLAVAVLMAELLDERRAAFQSDPLWGVLAALANCPAHSLWTVLNDAQRNELTPTVDWWREQYHASICGELTQRLPHDNARLAEYFIVAAKLAITNTHIDVIILLDAINIDIRRSGLDRSPGWLPAFGYIVTFAFR